MKTQPFVEHEVSVKPGDSIQVRGLGRWDQNAGLYMRTGTCGPVVARFNPRADHAYLIDFVWGENLSCTQVVMDATVPEQPVPVQTEQVPVCS